MLDFLATTEVGPGSEASEWERREREESLAQVGEEGERLGAEAGDTGWGREGGDHLFFFFSFLFVISYCRASKGGLLGGLRGGHTVAVTLGGSVMVGKRYMLLS